MNLLPHISVRASLLAMVLTTGSSVVLAEEPGGPPPSLTYSNGSLHLAPPSGQTASLYTIHFTTAERLAAGQPWVIWAKQWPANVTDIDLAASQGKSGCEALGHGAVCFRPQTVGEHAAGQTRIYRAYAEVNGKWSAPSANLTVSRP